MIELQDVLRQEVRRSLKRVSMEERIMVGWILCYVRDTGRHAELGLDLGDFLRSLDCQSGQGRPSFTGWAYELMAIGYVIFKELGELSLSVRNLSVAHGAAPKGKDPEQTAVRRAMYELGAAMAHEDSAWLRELVEEAEEMLRRGEAASRVLAYLDRKREEQQERREYEKGRRPLIMTMKGLKAMEALWGRLSQDERAALMAHVPELMVTPMAELLLERAARMRDSAPAESAAAEHKTAQDAAQGAEQNSAPAESAEAAEHVTPGTAQDGAQDSAPAESVSAADRREYFRGEETVGRLEEEAAAAESTAPAECGAGAVGEAAAQPVNPSMDEDWAKALAHAIVAGLEEEPQNELSFVLRRIVSEAPVPSFEDYVQGLWERCGLAARGVERVAYDDFIEALCSKDPVKRAEYAIYLLLEGKPLGWPLQIHVLSHMPLQEQARLLVHGALAKAPPLNVPLEGEGAQAEAVQLVRLFKRMMEYAFEDSEEGSSPHLQRAVRDVAMEIFRGTRKLVGDPPFSFMPDNDRNPYLNKKKPGEADDGRGVLHPGAVAQILESGPGSGSATASPAERNAVWRAW